MLLALEDGPLLSELIGTRCLLDSTLMSLKVGDRSTTASFTASPGFRYSAGRKSHAVL